MGWERGRGGFTIEAGPSRFGVRQGANDGWGALFAHCFRGADAGAGVVVCASGEERAVDCIAEVARLLLQPLGVRGIDWTGRGHVSYTQLPFPPTFRIPLRRWACSRYHTNYRRNKYSQLV